MQWDFNTLLEFFSTPSHRVRLREGLHGLEKEGLRVTPTGDLALTPHPRSLGSALTHPHVTTDFSESQMELITSPARSPERAVTALEALHGRVARALPKGEMMWPFSAPCRLPDTDSIPIARYGRSRLGQAKEIYRKGLALRYGKMMQMLSGVHYNFSFSSALWEVLWKTFGKGTARVDFVNQKYLDTARHFLKYRWVLVYLFGASPVLDATYRCPNMARNRSEAISLRLSRCGYHNPAKISVSYDRYEDHLADLERAVTMPYPPYTRLGIEREGERIQLNDHLLQIPNEYYASIRLKPSIKGDDFLSGLKQRGVRYLEVRLFDVQPFASSGVEVDQLRFTHLFLVYCLFQSNNALSRHEATEATQLQQDVALHGRRLPSNLKRQGAALLQRMQSVARLMGPLYVRVLNRARKDWESPNRLPWARMLTAMKGRDFIEYGLDLAQRRHKAFIRRSSRKLTRGS